MATLNSIQNQQITYLSGINSAGASAAESFWTWNYDGPATYGPENFVAKWGASTAGSSGVISYAFAASSNWTNIEKAAFVASMDLWSAVANVTFVEQFDDVAKLIISRNADGTASGGVEFYFPGTTGSTVLGRAISGGISIDASADDFGPLGASLSTFGGYPWLVLLHEIGHVLGLGHAGAYDEGSDIDETPYTIYDSLAWSVMSYNEEGESGDGMAYNWGTTPQDGLLYANVPTTWMPLDVAAIQRIYGVAIDTPLSGGQTYGFHSNIAGSIGKFFDFNQNSRPIVTLWNKGVGNTLDLSGFTQASNVNMADGTFSSAGGLTNNIAIAYGTRIDTVIAGPGADIIVANNNSDNVLGGAGADAITGGAGNDHLYGAAAVAAAGDGADTIAGGAGSDYLQGNAGDDQLNGGDGSDRIQGGQGNDSIQGGTGNDTTNGNLGNDSIDGGEGNDSLRGGQGADSVSGSAGNDTLLGDLGTDTLSGGAGLDQLSGGGDADFFNFGGGEANFATSGTAAGATDVIMDFVDGMDRIHMDFGLPSTVLQGSAFSTFLQAAAGAQQILNGQPGFTDVTVLMVGNDVYLFYDASGSAPLEAVRLGGVTDPAAIAIADFI